MSKLASITSAKVDGLSVINRVSGKTAIREAGSLSITFDPSATAEDVKEWAQTCASYADRMGQLRTAGKLWMGKAVLEYAARKELTVGEAVDDMDLPDMVGLTTKTILTYVNAVQRMGPDAFIEGLSEGQILAAAQFKPPVSPDQMAEFASRRQSILLEAANDNNMTAKAISMRMRELQAEFGIMPQGKRQEEDLLSTYARLLYIKDHADEEWYQSKGITREDVSSWTYHYELELAQKGKLPFNLNELVIPHVLTNATVIDVDQIPDIDA